ncbi:MAG: type II secretion system minor pseudopilin GspI [Gammaproteobacteria bacterium]
MLRACGFTLLEVMIAMTIVALVATKLTFALSGQINSMQRLEEKTMAHILAMNKMAEMMAEPEWPPLGKRDENVDAAHREWIVRSEVKNSALPKLRQIEVTVGLRPEGLTEDMYRVHSVRSLISQHYLPKLKQPASP